MKKKTLNEILSIFKEKHQNYYSYENFEYINYHNKSTITCPIHGNFVQSAAKHIAGQGCKQCNNKYSFNEVIEKLNNIHGNTYEFIFNEEYIDTRTNVTIKCRHGEIITTVSRLLQGQGCISCKGKKWTENDLREHLLTLFEYEYKEGFLKKKYLDVECKIHGTFTIKKDRHLQGQGCPKCSKRKKYDQEFFLECVSKNFTNLIYDKCQFIDFKTKVVVTCDKHGDFQSFPSYLLAGNGCAQCRNENNSYTQDEYLSLCIHKHPEICHDKVIYRGTNEKITLICKVHGEFEFKAGAYLLRNNGCPFCFVPDSETKGEKRIRIFLENNNIFYKQEYKQYGFYFDFYIPSKNTYIEFNGKQHYEPIAFFGGEKSFNRQKERDELKDTLSNELGFTLIKIPYWEMNEIEKILEVLNEN